MYKSMIQIIEYYTFFFNKFDNKRFCKLKLRKVINKLTCFIPYINFYYLSNEDSFK